MKAFLILEDGTVLTGESFGAVISEVVFNTSMTGYLEILTDPSYAGQSVVMTYPLIGNYGICMEDMESVHPWPKALIVRECAKLASNFRNEMTLDEFLKKNTPVMRYYIYLKEDYRPNDDISASYFIRTPAAGKDLNCIEIELKKTEYKINSRKDTNHLSIRELW